MSKKILVVDDDSDIRDLLDLELRASGYDVVFARDAIGAVSTARKEKPDLILLDIGLPGGSGFVIMQRLRAFPALERTPIIVITASDPGDSRERSAEFGIAGFFHKPFDADELLAEIERALAPPERLARD
jgi:DNA-binding response OmpR family regulator